MTALGAAGLAGIASGFWSNAAEFASVREAERFTPGQGTTVAGEGFKEWHRAVRATLAWARDREQVI